MPGKDRKKQLHEQKRREKRAAQQRLQQGGGTYSRIGTAGSVTACYINSGWKESGLASIRILLRVPGGGHALAAFLVDCWCIGLKDAFGRLEATAQEFRDDIQRAADHGAKSVPLDFGTARRLIAGAIRWSHEHDFRLPPRYERWVAAIGGVGDWHTADVSDFGVNGKLRYVGKLEDLQHRLTGATLDEFLARSDVDFIGGLGPSMLDDDDEVMEESLGLFQQKALDGVRQWCFANGRTPHPRLPEAVELLVESLLEVPASAEGPLDEATTETDADAARSNIDRFLSLEAPESEFELRDALAQLSDYVRGFETPEQLTSALGISDDDEALDRAP